MKDAKRCPGCYLPPEMTVDCKFIVLACAKDGHMAMGESLAQAVEHWNHYVDFMNRQAGRAA